MNFKALHQQSSALIIGNAWDVASARVVEQAGYQAIGTSSAAIATGQGLEDGESVTFDELLIIAKAITRHTSLPLTVDLEGGYSRDPQQVVEHVMALANVGVVGINIEDSLVQGERKLVDSGTFSELISFLKAQLQRQQLTLFVNVRTDPFILGASDALAETKRRVRHYQAAGADGIFVPGIEREQDIVQIVAATELPLNVMCMPNLMNFQRLTALGVKRISMGNFVYETMLVMLGDQLQKILKAQSFDTVFAK